METAGTLAKLLDYGGLGFATIVLVYGGSKLLAKELARDRLRPLAVAAILGFDLVCIAFAVLVLGREAQLFLPGLAVILIGLALIGVWAARWLLYRPAKRTGWVLVLGVVLAIVGLATTVWTPERRPRGLYGVVRGLDEQPKPPSGPGEPPRLVQEISFEVDHSVVHPVHAPDLELRWAIVYKDPLTVRIDFRQTRERWRTERGDPRGELTAPGQPSTIIDRVDGQALLPIPDLEALKMPSVSLRYAADRDPRRRGTLYYVADDGTSRPLEWLSEGSSLKTTAAASVSAVDFLADLPHQLAARWALSRQPDRAELVLRQGLEQTAGDRDRQSLFLHNLDRSLDLVEDKRTVPASFSVQLADRMYDQGLVTPAAERYAAAGNEELDRDSRRRYGLALLAENKPREALAIFEELQATAPTASERSQAFQYIGNAYFALQDHDQAREAFERAIEAWPGNAEAEANLGRVLLYSDDPHGGAAHLQRARGLGRDTEDVRLSLIVALLSSGRADEAEALTNAVLEGNPDQPRALNDRAWIRVQRGQVEAATQDIDRALASDPQNPAFLHTKCIVLEHDDQLDRALEFCRRAFAIMPKDRYRDDIARLEQTLAGQRPGATAQRPAASPTPPNT